MAATGEKQSRSGLESIDPRVRPRKKKSKALDKNGDVVKSGTSRTQRKIGLDEMLISRGQREYSIREDLVMQQAHITIGQVVACCPSLRRELRTAVSTRKNMRV